MPGIIICESAHFEGENVRTIGRLVGNDQSMLTKTGAGPLTVSVSQRGRTLYTKTLPVEANRILDPPTQPDEWGKSGFINFDYTWDHAGLLLESPSFEFKGTGSYTIVYDFSTENDGHVIGQHRVRIVGVPG